MSSKKVLLVGPSLGRGGAERVMADMSVFLDELGYKVTLITAYRDVDYHFKGTHITLGLCKGSPILLFQTIWAFFRWKSIIKKISPEIIIDSRARKNVFRELLIHLFIYNDSSKKFFICHRADLQIYFPKPRFLFRGFYKKINRVISVSSEIENKLNQLGLPNTRTIYNGFDFKRSSENKKPRPRNAVYKYILCVGRMDDNVKQFDHAITCYSQSSLPEKGIHLVILGQGSIEAKLKTFAKTFDCSDQIHFPGFVSDSYPYFSHAEFFVLTSKIEGFPMVLIESLACGTPVVSYDCPTGPKEIVRHEKNGLLVPKDDKSEMTSALNRMINDVALYEELCFYAKQSVSHLSMEKIAKEWKALIEQN